jgi:hypothetical protein
MNNNQKESAEPHIEVMTDYVIARDLKITGQPAQRIIDGTLQGTPPLETLNRILDVGAIAMDSVQNKQMQNHMNTLMENFTKLVGKEANENFPKALEEKTKPFIESILGFLNPDQASSLNSQLNSIMEGLKKDLLKQVADDNKSQKETLDQALKSLGFIKQAIDQSPRKGTPHQDYVGEVLERFAGSVDNVTNVSAGATGSSYAAGKSNSGDYLVTLGETFNTSNLISFSVEAKNSKLSEKAALKEISDNCKNRGVDVGIIAFASQVQAPTQGRPIKIFPGNKIFVVCDNGSETAFYAAYAYARFIAKQLKTAAELDHNFLASAIEEIIKYLDIEDTINKDAKSARNAVDRLVSTSLTARSEVLRVLSQFEEKA